jgi:hypothetical protein
LNPEPFFTWKAEVLNPKERLEAWNYKASSLYLWWLVVLKK